jgi:hypothetical protein
MSEQTALLSLPSTKLRQGPAYAGITCQESTWREWNSQANLMPPPRSGGMDDNRAIVYETDSLSEVAKEMTKR